MSGDTGVRSFRKEAWRVLWLSVMVLVLAACGQDLSPSEPSEGQENAGEQDLVRDVMHLSREDLVCAPELYTARLTTYQSYPEPGSTEWIDNGGGRYLGQFWGLEGTFSEQWVTRHNIVSVFPDDWDFLGMKILIIRQGSREIVAQVLDICGDWDCNGCCTDNRGGYEHLIDMESYTTARFGSDDGEVEFQICIERE